MGTSVNNVQGSLPVFVPADHGESITKEIEPKDIYLEMRPSLEFLSAGNEAALFARCREVLTEIADDRIPRNKDQLKGYLQTLKKVGEMIDRGAQIPPDISRLYALRHKEIEANIKAFVAAKNERVARGISLSSDPDIGIRELCSKAKSALPWVDYIV